MRRLIILGDTPTRNTGFGRVIRNLLVRWLEARAFDEIHLWAIGYWGQPHQFTGVDLWPAAQPGDDRWESQGNLTRFATWADSLRPTHVFLLQDIWGLMPLCNVLGDMTDEGIRTALYFPVDAPLEPCWTRVLSRVRHPVAYCAYGRDQAALALAEDEAPEPVGDHKLWRKAQRDRRVAIDRLAIVPHGVDACWIRLEDSARRAARKELFGDAGAPHVFLMAGVAQNQRRKGLPQSLALLAAVRQLGFDARLYLHLPIENAAEGIHLGVIARQFGLRPGVDVLFGDQWHRRGQAVMDDAGLGKIYNAADLLLSTSLGEGWGLPLTEAMACGTPVAGPDHTAVREILGGGSRGLCLPLGAPDVQPADNNRLRPRIDVPASAALLAKYIQDPAALRALADNGMAWARRPELSWDVIAKQWVELLQ